MSKWTPPAAGLRQSACPLAGPWVPVSPFAGPYMRLQTWPQYKPSCIPRAGWESPDPMADPLYSHPSHLRSLTPMVGRQRAPQLPGDVICFLKGLIITGGHTLWHTHIQSLTQGQRGPLPHGLAPAAALSPSHAYRTQKALPQVRDRKEFEETGQAVLAGCRACRGKHTDQATVNMQSVLFSLYPSISPLLFPSKSLATLPCPCFCSSPKHT